MDRKTTTQTLLWLVLGALSLAAGTGIYVVILGRNLPWEVVATLLSIGLFSLTALGASVVYFSGVWTRTMIAAGVLSLISMAFYIVSIWFLQRTSGDLVPRTLLLLAIVTIALPHAGLLALTRFEGPWAVVRFAVLVTLFALSLSLSAHVVFATETHWQLTSVLSILTGLGTIGLPVAQKLYGLSREPPALESTPAEVFLHCPRCGAHQTVRAGKSECVQCRLRIEIQVEEPRCPNCSYLLFKLTSDQCPECGTRLAPSVHLASVAHE